MFGLRDIVATGPLAPPNGGVPPVEPEPVGLTVLFAQDPLVADGWDIVYGDVTFDGGGAHFPTDSFGGGLFKEFSREPTGPTGTSTWSLRWVATVPAFSGSTKATLESLDDGQIIAQLETIGDGGEGGSVVLTLIKGTLASVATAPVAVTPGTAVTVEVVCNWIDSAARTATLYVGDVEQEILVDATGAGDPASWFPSYAVLYGTTAGAVDMRAVSVADGYQGAV